MNEPGPWSSWIRRGLDQYFQKKYHNSLNCYLYAGELGSYYSITTIIVIIIATIVLPYIYNINIAHKYINDIVPSIYIYAYVYHICIYTCYINYLLL